MYTDARENETLDVFARIYDQLLDAAGGKFNTFSAARLSSKPTRWTVALYLLFALSSVLLALVLASMAIVGINALHIASSTMTLILIGWTYGLLRKEKASRYKRYRQQKDKALHYEPENLWGKGRPEHGERGRLVKAVLGARHIAMLVADATTVPLSVEVVDGMASHLVRGISASKEDDIHEYYVKETIHLCKEINRYYSRYYPIIELHQIIRYGEN